MEVDETHAEAASAVSGLFGRDMIYLAFWALQIILAAALTPITTRLMGATEFGQAAACVAVTQLLNCLFSFALYTSVQRAYAREGGEDQARHIMGMAIGLSLLTGSIAYATGRWWCPAIGLGPFPPAVRYAVLWAVATAVTGPSMGLVRSKDNLRGFVAASFTQSVFAQALALTLVIVVGATAANYILGQFIGEVLTAVIALSIARPKLPSRVHVPMLKDSIRYSSALVPAMIAGFVFDASDRLVVHGDLGAEAVGRYAVARNVGGFALVLLQLVGFVWMPRLFRISDPDMRRRVLAASRTGLYVLVAAFVIAVSAMSPVLLAIWAPKSFDPSSLLLITALVAAGALPAADSSIYTQLLIVNGRTRAVAVAAVATAMLNLGLNLALVPVWGIVGSAAITFFCYVLGTLRGRWLAGKAGPPTDLRTLAIPVGGAALCIGLAFVPTSAVALGFRSLIAGAAILVFFVEMAALVRPETYARLRARVAPVRTRVG